MVVLLSCMLGTNPDDNSPCNKKENWEFNIQAETSRHHIMDWCEIQQNLRCLLASLYVPWPGSARGKTRSAVLRNRIPHSWPSHWQASPQLASKSFWCPLSSQFQTWEGLGSRPAFFYCHFPLLKNIRSALLKSHGENFPVLFPACQLRRGSDTPVLDGCRSAQRLRNQPGRSVQPAEAPIELGLEGHRCHHCPGAKKPIMSHMGISHNGGCSKNSSRYVWIPCPLSLNAWWFKTQTYLGILNRGLLIWGGCIRWYLWLTLTIIQNVKGPPVITCPCWVLLRRNILVILDPGPREPRSPDQKIVRIRSLSQGAPVRERVF